MPDFTNPPDPTIVDRHRRKFEKFTLRIKTAEKRLTKIAQALINEGLVVKINDITYEDSHKNTLCKFNVFESLPNNTLKWMIDKYIYLRYSNFRNNPKLMDAVINFRDKLNEDTCGKT